MFENKNRACTCIITAVFPSQLSTLLSFKHPLGDNKGQTADFNCMYPASPDPTHKDQTKRGSKVRTRCTTLNAYTTNIKKLRLPHKNLVYIYESKHLNLSLNFKKLLFDSFP